MAVEGREFPRMFNFDSFLENRSDIKVDGDLYIGLQCTNNLYIPFQENN